MLVRVGPGDGDRSREKKSRFIARLESNMETHSASVVSSRAQGSPLGGLLKRWRAARRVSQMDLAFAAKISTRHLSFIETGRANPSRSVVLKIADALQMPLRDRNALLEAAGFARVYRETDLDNPELAQVRRVLEFLLERHEPYSAVVLDRNWNVLLGNTAHHTLLRHLSAYDPDEIPDVAGNLLRSLFDSRGLRPSVVNWEEVAGALIDRLHREAVGRPDEGSSVLLQELLDYPDVPREWRAPDPLRPTELLLPMHFRTEDLELRLVSTITMFGTPQDVTLEEIRLETFFPADEDTDRTIRSIRDVTVSRELGQNRSRYDAFTKN